MSDLYIKQELIKNLPQVDAVLLDVDGVILDVSQSFRVVIARTVQYYATEVLKLEDTGPLLHTSETELFKLAGGFNDDGDLTNAVIALVIAKQAQTGATDTAALRDLSPNWEQYTADIKRLGGGLPAAESAILETLTPHQRRDFAHAWNPKLVVRIFQETYAGDSACRQLYGFDPEHIHGEGYYQQEKVMLSADALPSNIKYGVVTGRSRSETHLALKMAKLLNKIPDTAWQTPEDGVKKPDGRALLMAREKVDFRYGIYIGDTMDDLQTVLNYRELKGAGKAKIISCISLSGPSGETHRRLFLEAGAEIVAPNAETILQYLGHVLK